MGGLLVICGVGLTLWILSKIGTGRDPTIVVYDEDHPNPNPLSDADGHIFDGYGTVSPIYHESHVPAGFNLDPVDGLEGYYHGGPK